MPRYRERLSCFEYLHAFDDKDAEVDLNYLCVYVRECECECGCVCACVT